MNGSATVGIKSEQIDRLKDSAKRIGVGCAIALLFSIAFLCLLFILPEIVPGVALKFMPWISLLALIVVLPFLFEYLRPLITDVKFGDMLEITFREVQAKDAGTVDLEEKLNQLDYASLTAQGYAGAMTSYASQIIDKVKEIQKLRVEVLSVDLGSGNRWVSSNLYFLALLTASRTHIRQLVFLSKDDRAQQRYLGMCAPDDFIGHLGIRLPSLTVAQSKTDYYYGSLDYNLGIQFFDALNHALSEDPQGEDYKQWVTQDWLSSTLGTTLHQGNIEWHDRLDSEAYWFILTYPHRYVAVVRNKQYLFTIDQYKVGFEIAKTTALSKRKQ